MPSSSSVVILLTRLKTVSSMNSIRPSNIWALLAKCRYSAASDTSNSLASAAVVTFSPLGFSSIRASTCRICRRRAPGLGAGMGAVRAGSLYCMTPGECLLLALQSSHAALAEFLAERARLLGNGRGTGHRQHPASRDRREPEAARGGPRGREIPARWNARDLERIPLRRAQRSRWRVQHLATHAGPCGRLR